MYPHQASTLVGGGCGVNVIGFALFFKTAGVTTTTMAQPSSLPASLLKIDLEHEIFHIVGHEMSLEHLESAWGECSPKPIPEHVKDVAVCSVCESFG